MHDADALNALTARVNELARVCAQLGRENAELRSQVSALSARAVPTAGDTADDSRPGTWDFGLAERAARPSISRRSAVGVALAGAAAGIAGVTALTERSGHAGAPAGHTATAAEHSAAAGLTSVEIEATNTAPTATGSAVSATLSTVSAVVAGTNTNAGAGVAGTNTGTGPGVAGTSTGTGTGVAGNSKGTGPGVAAGNSGTGPGVRATSNHGRGGIFAGGAAQIQLTPAGSSHPKSGQRGDLYADDAGRLWYCKRTGASATWHQIA